MNGAEAQEDIYWAIDQINELRELLVSITEQQEQMTTILERLVGEAK